MSSIKTTQIDGDVSVGRNVSLGGKAEIAGSAHIGHNLKVDGWLEAPNIKGANKGIFLTVQELREAYPVPHDGWMAGVGASTPFTAYVGKGGDWVATGGTIEVNIDLPGIEAAIEGIEEDVEANSQSIEALEERASDFESDLLTEDEYDKDTLILGKYYNIKSVGETALVTPGTSSTQNVNCGKYKVKKGRKITISVVGGTSNARGWGLTDNDLVVLSRSDESVDTRQNPVTLTPTVDGWLLVNCKDEGLNDFFARIEKPKLDTIENEIANIREDVNTNTSDIEDSISRINIIESEMVSVESHDSSELTVGKYYNIGAVGTTVPINPGSSSTQQVNCGRFAVKKGLKVRVAVMGGTSNARGYALTDNDRVVIIRSEAAIDTLLNPVTLIPTEDGWLYINCHDNGLNNFSVSIDISNFNNLNERVTNLEGRVTEVGESLEEVEDRVDKIEPEIEIIKDAATFKDSYVQADMIENKYWHLGKDSVTNNMTTTQNWSCFFVPIKKGDVAVIATKAYSSTCRGWALTDSNRVILSRSEVNTDTIANPVILTAVSDGYLFSNCENEYATDFSIEIIHKVSKELNEVKESIRLLENSVDEIIQDPVVPQYFNNQLPVWKETLKICALGNSYLGDSLSYLSDMISAAEIPYNNLCIYRIVKGGSQLGDMLNILKSGSTISDSGATCSRRVGGVDMNLSADNTLKEILSKDWDVIVLYMKADEIFENMEDTVRQMIYYCRIYCKNPAVALAWHTGWARESEKGGYEGGSEQQWKEISETTRNQVARMGINIIIPTGTALQNGRNSSLAYSSSVRDAGELTRDGVHASYGVGKYIAAATWFEALLAPVFGISVLGNATIHDELYDTEAQEDAALQALHEQDPVNNMYFPPQYVTRINKRLCQVCAIAAIADKWHITDVDNFNN